MCSLRCVFICLLRWYNCNSLFRLLLHQKKLYTIWVHWLPIFRFTSECACCSLWIQLAFGSMHVWWLLPHLNMQFFCQSFSVATKNKIKICTSDMRPHAINENRMAMCFPVWILSHRHNDFPYKKSNSILFFMCTLTMTHNYKYKHAHEIICNVFIR